MDNAATLSTNTSGFGPLEVGQHHHRDATGQPNAHPFGNSPNPPSDPWVSRAGVHNVGRLPGLEKMAPRCNAINHRAISSAVDRIPAAVTPNGE